MEDKTSSLNHITPSWYQSFVIREVCGSQLLSNGFPRNIREPSPEIQIPLGFADGFSLNKTPRDAVEFIPVFSKFVQRIDSMRGMIPGKLFEVSNGLRDGLRIWWA
jgi:hypothetical protein